MLEGFGLAPVCIELDLDSYDGDWRHVARFRGRSGWLTVAEAQLRAGRHEWTTTLVAACDEWGEAVPSFMAPNLLACACSLPQPCDDYPPAELDTILQLERGELKRRWLRENNQTLKALDAETAAEVERLEAEAKQRMLRRDAAIADLRRRRRAAGATHEQRTLLTELIRELEDEQDQIAEELATDRSKLRGTLIARERDILHRTNVRVGVDPLFYVNWQGSSSVRGRPAEIEALWQSVSRTSSFPASSGSGGRRDDDGDASISQALVRQAQAERRPCRVHQAEPPTVPDEKPMATNPVQELPPKHVPSPKLPPSGRAPRMPRATQSARINPFAKSSRFRRAAADIWLQSNRLVSRLSRNGYRDDQLQRLRERYDELRDRARHLERQLGEYEAPPVMIEIQDNLTALEELLFGAKSASVGNNG
jgi:hypothetical protein